MSILSNVLLYGVLLALEFSLMVLFMVRSNPRLLLQDYPKDLQAAVPPKTREEKRQTLNWGIPLWILMLGCPTAAALTALTANAAN